jgi:hypothetical protein
MKNCANEPLPSNEVPRDNSPYWSDQQREVLRGHFKMQKREHSPGARPWSYEGHPTVTNVAEWLRAYHRKGEHDVVDFHRDMPNSDAVIPSAWGYTLFEFCKRLYYRKFNFFDCPERRKPHMKLTLKEFLHWYKLELPRSNATFGLITGLPIVNPEYTREDYDFCDGYYHTLYEKGTPVVPNQPDPDKASLLPDYSSDDE